jgi:glycosyltransferase involved in cell wall biosynthesis
MGGEAFTTSVVVGTFGASHWSELAQKRAVPSVPEGIPVFHEHGYSLAQARNAGLNKVETPWVIHLDADDELSPDYIEQMAKGTCDLRVPSRLDIRDGVTERGPYMPQVWGHSHQCVGECLRYGNWAVVGTAVRTDLAREVGGWEEFGWSEDWALWARCWKAGGTIEPLPEAIYRAHRNRRSRNHVTRHASLHWHREIEKAVWPEEASTL